MSKIEISGYCEERFEPVKEVFAKNFEEGLDLGASLAVTMDVTLTGSPRSLRIQEALYKALYS